MMQSPVAAPTTNAYAIRRVLGADAQHDVAALWRRTRKSSPHVDALFRWYYEENAAGPTQCFLVVHGPDEEVVGMAGLAPRALYTRDGQRLSAAVLGDFVIDKRHRTLLPAMKLQREIYSWGKQRYDLIYGFPNDAAQPVMKRLGYRSLGQMARYVLVLRHARYVQQRIAHAAHAAPRWLRGMIESPLVSRAIALPIDLWSRFGEPGLSRTLPGDQDLRLVGEPGAEFAALFERSTLPARILGQRDGAFLRWRFLERPDQRSQLWALYRHGALGAYAVVYRDGHLAHVRDVFGLDEEHIGALLVALGGHMRSQEMSALSLLIAAPASLLARLEQVGFRRRGDGNPLIGLPGDSERFTNANGWYLTEADEDQ